MVIERFTDVMHWKTGDLIGFIKKEDFLIPFENFLKSEILK